MRASSARWIAEVTAGRVIGDPETAVGPDVVIDTRKATPGCLFVALPGERVDGHDFVCVADQAGAGASLVTRQVASSGALVLVEDGIEALTDLARAVVQRTRASAELQVLAITGSSGKTSTKDVLAQMLEAAGPTVSPVGSFNNEIGVPLTACGVDEQTRFLVSEMGARGRGHIRWLCDIVAPDISLVLNVGTAHLGEFGSTEAIAQAKGEIVEGLPPQGWAVLNLDDAAVAAMAGRTQARIAWFSTRADAQLPEAGQVLVRALDLRASDLEQYSFTLVVEGLGERTEHEVSLPLIGAHQVPNALAAAAAALVAGVDRRVVTEVLGRLRPRSPWRMELTERGDGAAIINDSYNANPDSMQAALGALARIGAARRAARPGARLIAVLGDMLELGEESTQRHRHVGAQAADAGVDELYVVGEQAHDILAGAAEQGLAGRRVSVEEASSLGLAPDDVVLVKASRGLALERVVAGLVAAGDHDSASTGMTRTDLPITKQEPRA